MKKLLLKLIHFYQTRITVNTPPVCRFTPTCSEYARQAITIHGVCKGLILALWRFLRCNPLFRGGYDPVPEYKRWR